MFSQIYSATVAVADQDAALAFYVDTVGWGKPMDAPFDDDERWLTVRPQEVATVLVLADASWSGWRAPTDGASPRDTGITLVTPDFDAAFATPYGRGVACRAPVTTLEWSQ